MKRLIVGALALFLIAGAAQAQDHGKQRQGNHQHFQKLNLTDAQKAQLKEIRQKERNELQALEKNDQMIVRDWKAKKKEIRERSRKEFASVLTPEQRQMVAKMGKNRKHEGFAQRRFGHGGRGQAFRKGMKVGAFGKDLNLTQEQKDKLKDMRSQFRTKAQDIRNNKDLTQDQKKSQFKDLMKDQKEQMKSVLTPEQLEKVQSHMKERRNRDTK